MDGGWWMVEVGWRLRWFDYGIKLREGDVEGGWRVYALWWWWWKMEIPYGMISISITITITILNQANEIKRNQTLPSYSHYSISRSPKFYHTYPLSFLSLSSTPPSPSHHTTSPTNPLNQSLNLLNQSSILPHPPTMPTHPYPIFHLYPFPKPPRFN